MLTGLAPGMRGISWSQARDGGRPMGSSNRAPYLAINACTSVGGMRTSVVGDSSGETIHS
jgi:hypothetical protein